MDKELVLIIITLLSLGMIFYGFFFINKLPVSRTCRYMLYYIVLFIPVLVFVVVILFRRKKS